jgi:hypothetical protein
MLCIPEHVALQLKLETESMREVSPADGRSMTVPYDLVVSPQPARNHGRSVEPEYSSRARESYRRPPLEMRQQRSVGGPYLRHGEHHADECITEVAARKVIPEIKLVRAENTQITNLRDHQQTAR